MKGTVLGDRYELLDKIGEGGMSLVYRARCRILDRIVAVKILKEEFSQDANFVQKFKTEALAAARLSHPNIVNVYDVGQQDGIYYIVMEYIEGKTLKEVICQEAPLEVERAIDIAVMICDGLHHAHERGIVHKDIKPQNILVTDNGIVKVADFGIAQAISKKTITFGGNIIGSVQYLSPEQAKGEPVTRATDIYSLGCVLYEMVTGKIPFDAESPITVALKHIHDDPKPPRSLNSEIPAAFEEIILNAMDKVPQYRFATAEELRNALLNLHNSNHGKYSSRGVNGKTIIMPPVGTEGVEGNVSKRKLRFNGVMVIVAILGLLSGVLFVMTDNLFGKEVVVPEIEGKQIKEAKEELKKVGLDMEVKDQVFSREVEKDRIISQDPGKGMRVKEGRKIKVVLSLGIEMQKAPELVGMRLSEAQLRLANEGLGLGKVDEIYDTRYQEGFVVSQQPSIGSPVEKGSKISLMVSKGKEPDRIPMPKLIGLSLEDARKKLTESNLVLEEIKTQESDKYLADQVMGQDTQPGVLIAQESNVVLTVSKGPGPVAQTRAIEFQLPEEQDFYKVVVKVADAKGERDVYNELRRGGETIYLGVNYYGSGTAEIWLNGIKEQTLNL